MKNTILKIGFAAALLVRFFTPSLVQFDANHHPGVKMPFHFSDGKVIVPVVKRATFLRSGFVVVDFKKGDFHFLPVRNNRDATPACSVCSFNTFRATNVNTEAAMIHLKMNVHIPVINRSGVKNLRDKIVQRIKEDLGIRNKPSKKECEKLQED